MARGSFWDELGRDRDRRRRAEIARLRAEAQIRKDERRAAVGSRRDEAAREREERDAEAAALQAELTARTAELTGVLRAVVAFPVPTIGELRALPPRIEPEPHDGTAPRWAEFAPPEPGLLGRIGHRRATAEAKARLDEAYAAFVRRRDDAAERHHRRIMQMDPYEFERLIAALFRAKGYEAWHTQSSRDDGIDAIATKRDAHVPVECLIQVKRTRNVVPPKEIQALMGALAEHPTATNGLLVTTSWFSDRSRRRGWDRRIGTMEGGELREQIRTHLSRDVVISARPPLRRR